MTPERTHGKSPEAHGKIVRDGYDKIAREYYQDRDAFRNEREIAEFLAYLPDGGVVLDIGCGGGIPILRMLLDTGFIAKGIDFSKGMLELAKENVPEAELIHGDVTKTEFEEMSLDGVISTYAIIHIHKSYHPILYLKIYKWLKHGGVMLMGTSWSEWEEIHDYYGVPMAWSHPAPERSLQMIRNAGFEVIFDRLVTAGGETVYWILAKKN